MKIIIKTIPHKKQRYVTSGDYWEDWLKNWQFRVSKMSKWEYEACVIIHELIEAFLAIKRKIKWEDIDKFDVESGLEDPGDSKKAPYYKEHQFATKIEKMFCKELGMNWDNYNKDFDKL